MLKKTIVGILVVLIILFFSGYLYLQSLKPDYRGTIQLKGLSGKVEILYDDFAVPHIYAENEEDLFTAFGYVHAQDRLFQMELLKRVSSGRLAEVFGKEMLSTDIFFRTLSFEKHAAFAIAERDPDSPMMKASLAYLKGVNAYIRNGKTPIEFTLAGIPKEEFTLTDIEKIVGFMGYTFEAAFQSEAVLTYIQNKYGSDYIKDFSQSWPDRYAKLPVDAHSATLKTAETLALIEHNLSKINRSLIVKPFHGSNGWVVSGSKTKSGKPILSNDTHMAFSQPSVWYEAHLECPTLSVYGNFVAGTPVPALGHNRNGGWGLTMFENDEADFYEEKTNPENQNEVWYRDRWVALEVRKEKIRVKDNNDTTILVKKSPHGYILNGALGDITDDFKNPIALQWVYHQFPSKHMEVFYNLCKAQNVNDARKAVKPLTAPGLNFMWADVQGNIAWWAAGKLPIRPKHVNSFIILNGSSGDDDWQGYLDFDQNPQILNPENGFLFTANNQPEDMGTGEIPGYYVPSNRAKRIKELLDSDKNDWTVESMRPIINDVISSTYPEVIDSLIKNADKNLLPAEFNEILTLLSNWKGEHELTSTEPTLYYRWIYEIYRHAMHDELGDLFFDSFDRSHAFKRSMRTFFLNESSPWWDNINTPEKETRGEVFSNALIDAVNFLKKQLGENNSGWQWHKVHTLEHPHAMGKVKALRSFFNVGPFPAPGGSETINNLDFNMDSTGYYSVSSGPALRRIIDFATPESAHSVNPTGQSGYFFSKHYKDQAKMFVEGGYRNERMNRQEIERVKIGRMVLLP